MIGQYFTTNAFIDLMQMFRSQPRNYYTIFIACSRFLNNKRRSDRNVYCYLLTLKKSFAKEELIFNVWLSRTQGTKKHLISQISRLLPENISINQDSNDRGTCAGSGIVINAENRVRGYM